MRYAIASGLIGFHASELRVRIIENVSADTVLVRTADLRDAGTPLALNVSQIRPMADTVSVGVRHSTGLCVMGAQA